MLSVTLLAVGMAILGQGNSVFGALPFGLLPASAALVLWFITVWAAVTALFMGLIIPPARLIRRPIPIRWLLIPGAVLAFYASLVYVLVQMSNSV